MRIGVEHRRLEVQPVQVALDDRDEFRLGLADMREGEVEEGSPDPANRIEHVHRALHDVGEVLPPHRRERFAVEAVDVAVEEAEFHRAADDIERRPVGRGDRLDEGGFARARLAREAVDLVAVDVESNVVNCPHFAVDAKILHLVVGAEALDREDRAAVGLGRRCASRRPSAHAAEPAPRIDVFVHRHR